MEDKRAKKLPKKHLWKPEEDLILKKYVETHGEGNWASVSQQSGLKLIFFSFFLNGLIKSID